MKSTAAAIFIFLFSTLCFYVPATLFGLDGFDVSLVPSRFYNYYAGMMAGAFCLNIMYAAFLLYFIKPSYLFLKIMVCWLVVGETYTLIYHIINKVLLLNVSSTNGKILTIIVFMAGCSFFLYRAIKNPRSDRFEQGKTFLIRSKPKNLLGVFSYIYDHTGHKSIYQDGKIYAFKLRTGKIEEIAVDAGFFKASDLSLKEINRIENIQILKGRKFNLLTFNCNHFNRYAKP